MEAKDYWFDLNNENWLSYLEREGYVVIKQVANATEVEKAIDLYWNHYEESNSELDRNSIDSWENWYVDIRGIQTNGPLIQSAGAWFLRGLPKVKKAFSSIWNTQDLIVSMDSLITWKPWWVNPKWKPMTEGLHMDQNPFSKPDRICVQGMLPLYDVTEDIGGLEVVPRSNTVESLNEFRKNNPNIGKRCDFIVIRGSDPIQNSGKLLVAEAGDLILWDSLTVHGGLVGPGKCQISEARLARMSQTICMVPRERASKGVLKDRKKGFEKGWGFSHWPNESNVTSLGPAGFQPLALTPEQQALL